MSNQTFIFTLWDVGHGISIWLQMPNGTHQWIDLGITSEFSPSEHVWETYGVTRIENLFISHPDQDHLSDLPNFIATFEEGYNPLYLTRNESLPEEDKYGTLQFQYQVDYKAINDGKPYIVKQAQSPINSDNNGGVEIKPISLDHGNYNGVEIEGNNTSVVVLLRYQDVLIVCPGDIEPSGWDTLWSFHCADIRSMIEGTDIRVLVAPHHGRKSGYSEAMILAIEPHLVIVSDVYGASETHPRYYDKPMGITFSNGGSVKYYSTKTGGRVQITISESGRIFGQYDS